MYLALGNVEALYMQSQLLAVGAIKVVLMLFLVTFRAS